MVIFYEETHRLSSPGCWRIVSEQLIQSARSIPNGELNGSILQGKRFTKGREGALRRRSNRFAKALRENALRRRSAKALINGRHSRNAFLGRLRGGVLDSAGAPLRSVFVVRFLRATSRSAFAARLRGVPSWDAFFGTGIPSQIFFPGAFLKSAFAERQSGAF